MHVFICKIFPDKGCSLPSVNDNTTHHIPLYQFKKEAYTNDTYFEVGAKVRYACLPDYGLVAGTTRRNCLSGGVWSDAPLSCVCEYTGVVRTYN